MAAIINKILKDAEKSGVKLLKVGDETFCVIPDVIAKRSGYFESMFRGEFNESSTKEIELQLPAGGDVKDFEAIYYFLMTG